MRLSFLLLFLSPLFLFSQETTPIYCDTWGFNNNEIIYIEDFADGEQVFYIKKKVSVSGKGITEDGKQMFTNQLQVLNVKPGEKPTDKVHVLYNPVFPTTKNFKIQVNYKDHENQDNIETYTTLVEKYPGLKNIQTIDGYNWNKPDVSYSSSLKSAFFKPKIKGFTCKQYNKVKNEVKKEAKGLLGGLNKLNSKFEGEPHEYTKTLYRYDEEIISDLNWEFNYNGDQDKKNFWKDLYHFGCRQTGNLIAFTSKKLKDDDANEYKEKEVVVFDKFGKAISKTPIKTETPWEFVQGRSYSPKVESNYQLESSVVVEKQFTSKKINKEGNKNQLKFTTITINGDVTENVVDVPFEAFRVDTLFHLADQRTILVGGDKNLNNKYIVEINQGESQVYTLTIDKKNSNNDFYSLIHNKNETYLTFWNNSYTKNPRGFDLYKIDQGNISGPLTINSEMETVKRWSFDVFYSDENNILIYTKEEVDKCFNAKFCTVPKIYRLSNLELTQINDPENDQQVFSSLEVLKHQKPYLYNDHLYYFGLRIDEIDNNGKIDYRTVPYIFNIAL